MSARARHQPWFRPEWEAHLRYGWACSDHASARAAEYLFNRMGFTGDRLELMRKRYVMDETQRPRWRVVEELDAIIWDRGLWMKQKEDRLLAMIGPGVWELIQSQGKLRS